MGVTGCNFPPMVLPQLLKGLALEGGDGNPGKQVQVQQEGLKLESKKDVHASASALSNGIKGRFPSPISTHALLINGCELQNKGRDTRDARVLSSLCREEEAQSKSSSPLPAQGGEL